MNLEQAKIQLLKGEFITHPYLPIGDYIYYKDGRLYNQQHEQLDWATYFATKDNLASWDAGWSLY